MKYSINYSDVSFPRIEEDETGMTFSQAKVELKNYLQCKVNHWTWLLDDINNIKKEDIIPENCTA